MRTKTDADPVATVPSLRLHTVNEAAVILRCGPDFLYDLVKERKVPFTRIGRRLLFTDAHLSAIVAHFECRPVQQ